MKKSASIFIIVFCMVMGGILLASCRKDDVCKAVVTVRLLRGTDDSEVVPGCTVTFGEPGYSDSVNFVGVTDSYGQIVHTWRNEAKLRASAEYDGHKGVAMIALVKGETIEADVLIPVN